MNGQKNLAAAANPGLFRFSMAQFFAALVILIVTYPFVLQLAAGGLIEAVLMMALLVSAALAVGREHRLLTVLLIVPALTCPLVGWFRPGLVPLWLITGTHAVFTGFVVVQLVRFVLSARRVNSEVMFAGISGYLMLGILWTPTFLMVSQMDPTAFSGPHLLDGHGLDRFDSLFLSFVSLTCVGCNDITPLSRAARMLLMVESLTGVLYLAVLIARLVALYTQSPPSEKTA